MTPDELSWYETWMNIPINDEEVPPDRQLVFFLVDAERKRQDTIHKDQGHDPYLLLVILQEEIGEICQELIKRLNTGEYSDNYYVELIQATAVMTKWAEAAIKAKRDGK